MRKKTELPKPNIVTVVEHLGGRVFGSATGGWRVATCPIHDDRSPSASVLEDECRWKCFTCDKHGDAIDLIMEAQGVGFAAAVEVAESLAGDDDPPVRRERRGSGLLPRAQGHRKGRRAWRAPWTGF